MSSRGNAPKNAVNTEELSEECKAMGIKVMHITLIGKTPLIIPGSRPNYRGCQGIPIDRGRGDPDS